MTRTPPDIKVEVIPSAEHLGELSSPVVERLLDRIDDIGDCVDAVAERLAERLANLATSPENWGLDEIELGFSLDLEAEAGVIVARAKTTAAFSVNLKWKRNAEVPAT
jgi:hypothetical protein